MKPVACWHHGDEVRLTRHLKHNRIDLYGRSEVTDKGTNRLGHWWSKMRLKRGDRVRIVVNGYIHAYATIDGLPEDLPLGETYREWGTAVALRDIMILEPPYPSASCAHLQGSHRFDGSKTSLLQR